MKAIRTAIGWLVNPVVFLSLFAPSVLTFALKVIRSEIMEHKDTALGKLLAPFFEHVALPGLVDYTIQFYTALLVWVFWVSMCYRAGLFHLLIHFNDKKPNDEAATAASPLLAGYVFLFSGIIVFLFTAVIMLVGQAAKMEVLDIYIKHSPQLGSWSLPPMHSPITWVRLAIGIHGVFLTFFSERTRNSVSAR